MKTTSRITLTPSELSELSETGAVRVTERMEPQPIKTDDGWTWSRDGEWIMPNRIPQSGASWVGGKSPTETGAAGILLFHPHRVGERLFVGEEWRPYMDSETCGIQYRHDMVVDESVANGNVEEFAPMLIPTTAANVEAFQRSRTVYDCEWESADAMPEWAARTHVTVTATDVVQDGDEWRWVTVLRVDGDLEISK